MIENELKMYLATYGTTYHHRKSNRRDEKHIAAANFDAAINVALEILSVEFGKLPDYESPSGCEYEITQAFVQPNEGIASTTTWVITKWSKLPGWTTALEMVVPQPRQLVYVNATETHYAPLRYAPSEMIEDEERVRFMAIMRGEKPWIEPEEQQNCSQQPLFETNQQEQAA